MTGTTREGASGNESTDMYSGDQKLREEQEPSLSTDRWQFIDRA